jgi:transcriptional regulator with XRE-family HTH domain
VGKTVIFDIEKGKDTIQLNTLLKILNVLNISITIESPLMKTFNIENEKIKNI